MNSDTHYRYLEDDEIVSHFIQLMGTDDLKQWQTIECQELIGFHFDIGAFIRNYYMMWISANPFNNNRHPDDRSMAVMVKVWKRLNPTKTYTNYAPEIIAADSGVCDCPSCVMTNATLSTSITASSVP